MAFHAGPAGIGAERGPALPLVGIATLVTPSSLAMLMATVTPLALNEPVGNRPSSFTSIRPVPRRLAVAVREISGVAISPSETMLAALVTGSISRNRHRSATRPASRSRVNPAAMRSVS